MKNDFNSTHNDIDLSCNKSTLFSSVGDFFKLDKKSSNKTITNISSLTKLDTEFGKIAFESMETFPIKSFQDNTVKKHSQTSVFSDTNKTAPLELQGLNERSINKSSSGLDEEEKSSDGTTSEIVDEESEIIESVKSRQNSSITISENANSYSNGNVSNETRNSVESMPALSNKISHYTSLKEFSSVNEIVANKSIKQKKVLRKSPLWLTQLKTDGTAQFKEYERRKRRSQLDELNSNDTSYESGRINLKEGSLKSSIMDVISNQDDIETQNNYTTKRVPNSAVIMMYRDDEDYVVNSVHRESFKKQ